MTNSLRDRADDDVGRAGPREDAAQGALEVGFAALALLFEHALDMERIPGALGHCRSNRMPGHLQGEYSLWHKGRCLVFLPATKGSGAIGITLKSGKYQLARACVVSHPGYRKVLAAHS